MTKRKNVLLTAYAVNPFKGSEDGTGWNISLELAKSHNVFVVTRKNNQPEIDRFFKEQPDPLHKNMQFYYYDLPKWAMFWKHKLGERGYVLYFYLWQMFLPLFVKMKGIKPDLSHAVNFHSDSHPQFLWMLGKPVFWGPIGHHPPVPKDFIAPVYSRKNYMKDRMYNAVKFVMRNADPFYYISKWTAKRIFVINSGINQVVRANQNKIIVLPAVANEKVPVMEEVKKEEFTLLSIGRFVYMKGFDVTIRGFAKFYHQLKPAQRDHVKLKLVGKGEELATMQQLIREEGIESVTEIIKWVDKSEMDAIYRSASVFLFGSHEGAGMVVPEALSYGLPVVCYGPGELCDDSCAIRIPYGKYNQSIVDFSRAIKVLYEDKEMYNSHAENAIKYAAKNFQWSSKADVISKAYALIK